MHATGQLIPPSEAQAAAEQAVAVLRESPRWQHALAATKIQSPLLVQELDRTDGYYYIVPYTKGEDVTARILIDAVSGGFGEATGIEAGQTRLPPYVDPSKTLSSWYGQPFTVGEIRVGLLRQGTVGVHAVLVWRPCEQSFTPFEPFYVLIVGDRVVYLRVDGHRFDRLTEAPPG
jgi:hypothetical protein